jgi:hypothetical protein
VEQRLATPKPGSLLRRKGRKNENDWGQSVKRMLGTGMMMRMLSILQKGNSLEVHVGIEGVHSRLLR